MNEIDKFLKDVNISKEQLEAVTLSGKVLDYKDHYLHPSYYKQNTNH